MIHGRICERLLRRNYWINTGKNEILEDVLKVATEDITEKLYLLLHNETVIARIDQNVNYRVLAENPGNISSLLIVAGYLNTLKKELKANELIRHQLRNYKSKKFIEIGHFI